MTPTKRHPKLLAYAQLARLSNLPTILTNTLLGVALALTTTDVVQTPFPWSDALLTSAVLALLYTFGMVTNDIVDARTDAAERPKRPIPSGRVSRSAATALAVILLIAAAALLLSITTSWTARSIAGALIACIILYNLSHKATPFAAILMAACRGLAVSLAATTLGVINSPDIPLVVAGASLVAFYTLLLTVIARNEAKPKHKPHNDKSWSLSDLARLEAAALILLPLIILPFTLNPRSNIDPAPLLAASLFLCYAAWIIYALVLAKRKSIQKGVHALLAGFCLLDATVLLFLDRPLPALAAAACFILTLILHKHIPGT